VTGRTFPEFLDLPPLASAAGTLRLPGSKSISNRTLLLAALGRGRTRVCDVLHSDDTRRMLEALVALGVHVSGDAASGEVVVEGCAGRFPVASAALFLGNAGTAFRPLTAALAMTGGTYELSGVPRMHERPIGDLVDALRGLGVRVDYLGNDGFPPLRVHGGEIDLSRPVRVRGDVSSQFLTALLMALPVTGRPAVIEVEGELISRPYVEITLALMRRFGVMVERDGWSCFRVPADAEYRNPETVHVEGDASGASYFLAAGAIGGGPVRVEGVGRDSIQGDVRFADALESLGARITWGSNWIEARAPESGRLKAFDLDLNHIPDAAMTLAAAALFADGPCTLRNVASWRVKETDRLAAMATELRKVGAEVVEGADHLRVTPPVSLRSAVIHTYDDHRMAMCLALATLGGIPLRIDDPGCVAKTFPEFFEAFAAVTVPRSIPVIAIDGPAASGKGTVAEMVAKVLGFRYLDSGAMYRLAAYAALRAGVALNDEAAVASLARRLTIDFSNGQVHLDGEDVTDAIRTPNVSAAASRIAALPAVRSALLWAQQSFRAAPGLVAEGRDMASVVFTDADLKVFLTASVEARAQRRHKQLMDKGMHASVTALSQEIAERDARDSQRVVAPMFRSEDSLLLDTTDIGPQDACDQVLGWYRQRARR
jgi:3-phosphoshikimate 1-carboxyvinyltransferase